MKYSVQYWEVRDGFRGFQHLNNYDSLEQAVNCIDNMEEISIPFRVLHGGATVFYKGNGYNFLH